MSRFSTALRDRLPNRICDHFDKYCEIINPVPFDPIKDIYQPSVPEDVWKSLTALMDSKWKSKLVNQGYSFDLYLGDDTTKSKYRRSHIGFPFDEGFRLPDIDIEISSLPYELRENIEAWTNKAVALKKLRSKLFSRVEKALDHGWDSRKHWDNYRGGWRGGATSGQGINTAGQLTRIWPELLPFLPADSRDDVRNAQVKSRLPKYIQDWGTPKQFMLIERPYHDNRYDPDDNPALDQRDPFTDEEWENEKRMLEGINHILTQMSLMKDVPRQKNYPSISLNNH